jgi:hypothetical protein
VASDRPPSRLAPPPGPGARFDAFERETLQSLNHSLRGVLTLGTESNRMIGRLADVLSKMHETDVANRDLTKILITESQLTREVLRELKDEIAMLRHERKAATAAKPERAETTAVKPRPIRKIAG